MTAICSVSRSQFRKLEFFKHENRPLPIALSLHGRLRLPNNKSELLLCTQPSVQPEAPSHYDSKVFDGAVVVHALPGKDTSTLGEYSDNIFIPWTEMQLQSCSRIDIVWDTYQLDTLKATTREVFGEKYPAMLSYIFTLLASYKTIRTRKNCSHC